MIAATEYTLTFTKDGFVNQVQRVKTPPSGEVVNLDVTLIPRAVPQIIEENATTATITGANGASVNLIPNFKDKQGNAVGASNGVQLTIIPVDVSSPIGVASFPGEFAGIEQGQTEASPLVSYGAVEYQFTQTSDGKILQLADNNTADIQIPIYTANYQNGTAIAIGDGIPLWSLNEGTGIWTGEGTGTVVASTESPTGIALSATVSHFTWWSAGVAMNAAKAVIYVNAPESGSALIKAHTTADIAWELNSVDTVIAVGESAELLSIPSNQDVCFWAEVSFTNGNIATTPESCVNAGPGSTATVDLTIETSDNLILKASPEESVSAVVNKAPLQIKIQPTTLETNVSYAIESGALPTGISLRSINDTTAVISGAPAEIGTFDFVVKGTDASNNTASISIRYAIRALNKAEAQEKIAAYAEDDTNLAPTVQDYATAGVNGVNAENIEVVNAAVAVKSRGGCRYSG